ncbi:MAG TPA: PEGA domain-containing protein, partial [Polyangia bacterium]|nr:PEGA domain-containing protein [Polyangia bacterium]
MWRRGALAALLFAALLQTPTVARADESPESRAEALIRQGIELRQAGKDERALVMFQRAYETLPTPRSAGQLGLSEMAVGYWLSAEQHLNEALQTPDHPWIAKNRASLQTALTRVRSNIGELMVTGPPAGASLTVNRRGAGTFPLSEPVRVPKGRVEIEISATGYVKAERSLQVTGGGTQEVSVTLTREVAAVEPPAARAV